VGDGDCDSWTDGEESTIGTDPSDSCPNSSTHDAYPADFDKNRVVNVFDLLGGFALTLSKTSMDPDWLSSGGQRADLDLNNLVNVFDILRMSSHLGYVCA